MGVNGGHILCFKHRRRVARDNTVKYYRHTLQLLPSPASLRSRNETSPVATIPTHDPELASKPSVTVFDLLSAKPVQEEEARAAAIDDPDVAGLRVVASPRRPTFLQQERWKAVQQAKLKGMSI